MRDNNIYNKNIYNIILKKYKTKINIKDKIKNIKLIKRIGVIFYASCSYKKRKSI